MLHNNEESNFRRKRFGNHLNNKFRVRTSSQSS